MTTLLIVAILAQGAVIWMLCRERARRRTEMADFAGSYARLTETHERLAGTCYALWNGGITHRYLGLLQIESVLRQLPPDRDGVGSAILAVDDLQRYIRGLIEHHPGQLTPDEYRFYQHLRQGLREGTI